MTTAIYFTSERSLPRNAAGVWNSCRVISDLTATCLATANEAILTPRDRHMTNAARVALCIKGLRGADGNWRADSGFNQSDVDDIHRAMFPDLPLPDIINTSDWSAIVGRLPIGEGGEAVSIAVRLSALPANDPARKWTAADHQMVLRARRGSGAKMELLRVDPMRPPNVNYQGDWVDADSVRKAARAIADGTIIAESYPIGGWTADKLKNVKLRKRIAGLLAHNERLERDLTRCEQGTDGCVELLDGQREAIADRLQEVVDEIREN